MVIRSVANVNLRMQSYWSRHGKVKTLVNNTEDSNAYQKKTMSETYFFYIVKRLQITIYDRNENISFPNSVF